MSSLDTTQQRILLIEPDAGLRSVHGEALRRHGYTVQVAQNYADVERNIRVHAFHVVILSVGKGDEEAVHYCQRLKDRNPDLPIMLITADGVTIPTDIEHEREIAEGTTLKNFLVTLAAILVDAVPESYRRRPRGVPESTPFDPSSR